MSTPTFGQPAPFGSAPAPEPGAPVEEAAPRSRRLMMLGAVGAAGVLTAVGAFLLLPAVLGGDEVAPVPPATDVASAPDPATAPEPEVDAVPESALPTLTQVAGRNPFQPQVGAAAGVAPDGTTAVGVDGAGTAVGGTVAAGASSPGASGPAGPAGPAGLDGLDGLDGNDGLNGLDGVNGLNGANGVDGAPGASAEYAWVTYRGPTTDGTAGKFDIITREGLISVEVKPRATDAQPIESGSLGGDRGTAASFVYFYGYLNGNDRKADLRFIPPPGPAAVPGDTAPSLQFTGEVAEPLTFLLPTYGS